MNSEDVKAFEDFKVLIANLRITDLAKIELIKLGFTCGFEAALSHRDSWQQAIIPKLERAVMLVETAWMDIEPIPCEVAAVEILKGIIADIKPPQKPQEK